MYSNQESVLQLIALMRAHGIRDCVLCPGSRNAPIVLSLSQSSDFRCYSIVDERSAGFFALGLALNTAKPVAVVCTSGSALLNLLPSVAEAYYQQVPLVVISADRPLAWIGQRDGQTIVQHQALEPYVAHSVSLPEIQSAEDEWYCNRLINEALIKAEHKVKTPVHINIPLSEPLFDLTREELPAVRPIRYLPHFDPYQGEGKAMVERLVQAQKRMVLVGQMNLIYEFSKEERTKLYKQFVWLGDHISNQTIPGQAMSKVDLILRRADEKLLEDLRPDILITYGGHTLSKLLKQYLRKHPPREHWHISPDGEIVDTFQCLSLVVEADPFAFLESLTRFMPTQTAVYPKRWESLNSAIKSPKFSYSAMKAVGDLLEHLPEPSSVHLANSSAVRYAQLFPLKRNVEVCSNRGVNGIEGSLSTAVGYALTSKNLNFVIIGDLSFFYDNNGLWHQYLSSNLRILLLNNQGGGIFYQLPQLEQTRSMEQFVATSSRSEARGLVEARGLSYRLADDDLSLAEGLAFLLEADSKEPRLLEVVTDKKLDVKLLQDYYQTIKI